MGVHIKIGNKSLCQCGAYHHLLGGIENYFALLKGGLVAACGHQDAESAAPMVRELRAHGNDARIVHGNCDQRGEPT